MPSRRLLACAARPGTSSRNVIAPACATTTSSSDGSGMIARSPVAPARIAASVPWPPSSSDGTSATMSSPSSRRRTPVAASARSAPRIAATPPFMSFAPRPYTLPSRISPPNGSAVQVAGSPIGTTSWWPLSTMRRPPARPARPSTTGSVSRGTSSPGHAGSSRIVAGSGWNTSTARPAASSRSASTAAIASSCPVTLGMRTSATSSAVSASTSTAAAAARASSPILVCDCRSALADARRSTRLTPAAPAG